MTRSNHQIYTVNTMATQISRLALATRPFWSLSLFSSISAYIAIARQRHALSQLDDHLLQDIGLTKHQANSEAERAPWDVPAHWRI